MTNIFGGRCVGTTTLKHVPGADMAMALHDLSMSKIPQEAAIGRALKQFYGAWETMFADFERRPHDLDTAISCVVNAAFLVVDLSAQTLNPDPHKQILIAEDILALVRGQLEARKDALIAATEKAASAC